MVCSAIPLSLKVFHFVLGDGGGNFAKKSTLGLAGMDIDRLMRGMKKAEIVKCMVCCLGSN